MTALDRIETPAPTGSYMAPEKKRPEGRFLLMLILFCQARGSPLSSTVNVGPGGELI
jgi:hypothetical protein